MEFRRTHISRHAVRTGRAVYVVALFHNKRRRLTSFLWIAGASNAGLSEDVQPSSTLAPQGDKSSVQDTRPVCSRRRHPPSTRQTVSVAQIRIFTFHLQKAATLGETSPHSGLSDNFCCFTKFHMLGEKKKKSEGQKFWFVSRETQKCEDQI